MLCNCHGMCHITHYNNFEQQHGDNGDNNNSYNSYDNNYDEDGNDKCWE